MQGCSKSIVEWHEYPSTKPVESGIKNKRFYKRFYYVKVSKIGYEGIQFKCWYFKGIWLCDPCKTTFSTVTHYRPAARNGKAVLTS